MTRRLKIAQVAPPLEPVPPAAYGGTERIVDELVRELDRRGHEVTTFGSGDSTVPGRLVATVPQALWRSGFTGDPAPWFVKTASDVLDHASEFDVIHSHIEWYSPLLARASSVPVVTTFHGRLDHPWATDTLGRGPGHLVAISRAQAAVHPDAPWAAVIHNGLSLRSAPFERRAGESLAFVGRIAPEKGIVDAIEVARRTGRTLRIAAKSGKTAAERDYFDAVFRPALERAGSAAEWLGEVDRPERDRLFATSYATLMPGAWPEPFGLVAIESLACGTPVLARRVGALPEIVREGIDGFFGDDAGQLAFMLDRVARLDRAAIRDSVLERFSAERMADQYEELYLSIVAGERRAPGDTPAPATLRQASGEPDAGRKRPGTRRIVVSGVRFEQAPVPTASWRPVAAKGPSRETVTPREAAPRDRAEAEEPPRASRPARKDGANGGRSRG